MSFGAQPDQQQAREPLETGRPSVDLNDAGNLNDQTLSGAEITTRIPHVLSLSRDQFNYKLVVEGLEEDAEVAINLRKQIGNILVIASNELKTYVTVSREAAQSDREYTNQLLLTRTVGLSLGLGSALFAQSPEGLLLGFALAGAWLFYRKSHGQDDAARKWVDDLLAASECKENVSGLSNQLQSFLGESLLPGDQYVDFPIIEIFYSALQLAAADVPWIRNRGLDIAEKLIGTLRSIEADLKPISYDAFPPEHPNSVARLYRTTCTDVIHAVGKLLIEPNDDSSREVMRHMQALIRQEDIVRNGQTFFFKAGPGPFSY